MKKKIFLPICLIISLALIISSVIVSLTAGINLGIDFVGGKQIEIKIPNGGNTNNYESSVSAVLAEYDLYIDSCFTEDKYTDSYFVVKVNTREISAESATEIREKIATKLSIPEENVGEVTSISGSVKQRTVLSIGIGVLCIFVALFIGAFIRYGIMEGLGMLFGSIHNMIISFALVIITRVQLNVSVCSAIALISLVYVGLFVLVCEKAREKLLSKQSKSETVREIYESSFKSVFMIGLVVLAGLLVFSISVLFVNSNLIKLFAASSIESIIVTAFTLIVSVALTGYLSEAKRARDKEKLSKNKIN